MPPPVPQEGTALREVPAARLEFARVMHLVLRLAAADKTHSEFRGFKRPWSVRQLDFTIHLLTLPDGELASPPEGARRHGPRRAPATPPPRPRRAPAAPPPRPVAPQPQLAPRAEPLYPRQATFVSTCARGSCTRRKRSRSSLPSASRGCGRPTRWRRGCARSLTSRASRALPTCGCCRRARSCPCSARAARTPSHPRRTLPSPT